MKTGWPVLQPVSPGSYTGPTGLEPATSDVTGRRSNQLNYDPVKFKISDLRF